MSCLIVRCRSCTPASPAELTEWLEDELASLREGMPGLLVRLTRLARDLPDTTVDDGWLIELELSGEQADGPFALLMSSLEDPLQKMLVRGLGPTLLVPVGTPLKEMIPTAPTPARARVGSKGALGR